MRQPLLISVSLATLVLLFGLYFYYSVQNRAEFELVDCHVAQQSCRFNTPFGEAHFSLLPQPPSSRAGISFELNLDGVQPDKVWVDLQGKEMYMGVNQTNLLRVNNRWSAPATLGVCTTGTMRWILTLILEREQQQKIYRFEFDAH